MRIQNLWIVVLAVLILTLMVLASCKPQKPVAVQTANAALKQISATGRQDFAKDLTEKSPKYSKITGALNYTTTGFDSTDLTLNADYGLDDATCALFAHTKNEPELYRIGFRRFVCKNRDSMTTFAETLNP